MSDIRKLIDIINETTTSGSVAASIDIPKEDMNDKKKTDNWKNSTVKTAKSWDNWQNKMTRPTNSWLEEVELPVKNNKQKVKENKKLLKDLAKLAESIDKQIIDEGPDLSEEQLLAKSLTNDNFKKPRPKDLSRKAVDKQLQKKTDESEMSKQQVIDYFVSRGKTKEQGAAAYDRGWRGPSQSLKQEFINDKKQLSTQDFEKKYQFTDQEIQEALQEDLRRWFKEKWVRFGPDGKIRGDCARGDDSEGKPKCLPQSKAHSLGQKGRASAAARKRRQDPNPERSGKAINVATKKKTSEDIENISEISKKTLKKYVKANVQDQVDRSSSDSFKSGRAGDQYNKAPFDTSKDKKREKGLKRALDKLSNKQGVYEELDEGWKSTVAGLGLAAAAAMNPTQARVSSDDISKSNINTLTGKPHVIQTVDQTKSMNQVTPGYSDEYLKKAASGQPGRFMINKNDASSELAKRQQPRDLGNGFQTITHKEMSGIKDTQSGTIILKSTDGTYNVIYTDNGKEVTEYGVSLNKLGPATQRALRQAEAQLQESTIAENRDANFSTFMQQLQASDIDKPVNIIVYGKMPSQMRAEEVWDALMEILPREYPRIELAQQKTVEISRNGGAYVAQRPMSEARQIVKQFHAYGIKARIDNSKRGVSENISPKTIHKLADRKNVKWDNEPSFLRLTKKLTGKEHLDDLSQDQLKTVKNYLEKQGVAEGHADQQRKIFKKNGKPVGEVGIDRESSPGNGQWYMKCYAYDIDKSGYDSYEEAVAELKHCLKQGVAEGSSYETDSMVSHISQIIGDIYPQGGDKITYMKLVAREMRPIVQSNPKLFRRAFGIAYDRFFHIDDEDDSDYTDYSMRKGEQGVAEGYSNTTFKIKRRKLNVPALIKAGAIFITYPHGEQGWELDNKEDWAYSLLSLYNVMGGGWQGEAKKYLKPESYKKAEQKINSSAPNLGSDKLVYDGKYNQILWSIKKLGIPDNVAFLDNDKQGVAEGELNEYRDALYTFVRSKFPNWPEYVLKDFLYAQAKGIRDKEELKDFLNRNQKDFGQVKWRLEKLPITLDIFTPKTQQMIKSRKSGSNNPFNVPKDAERHAQQLKMIKQQGVRTEPIIVAKLDNGYDLIEGWHRTIQHLKQYPNGYIGPAWVGYGATYTSESEQGLAEGSEQKYLWHGSRQKIDMLEPRQSVDTGGAAGSNQNAIYATSDPKVAIAMGLTTPGSDTGMFPNDPQMVLFKGNIRKGENVYLHKVPFNGPNGKPQFVQGGNSREFHTIPGVKGIKPVEIKVVPVDKYLNLIRQATPADLALQKKYMKQGVAEDDDNWSVEYKGKDYECYDQDHAINKARKFLGYDREKNACIIKRNGKPVYSWRQGEKIQSIQDVAEGSGKNVVKSVKVGNFRHDLVDTGFGWQVRIYNGDELYDTGMSKNSEQKGLAALEDAVAYTEKQTRTKRQGVSEYGTHPSQRVDPRTGKKYVPPKSPLGKGVTEGKITLSTDPNWYGAEVGDYTASGPVVNIPANRLVGFEPDDKMNQPKSKANVEKIVAGLKQGAKLPPLLVRKYKNGYQVLDGHHRFWAYKLLGVKSIPAQIVPDSDIEEKSRQGVAEGLNLGPDHDEPVQINDYPYIVATYIFEKFPKLSKKDIDKVKTLGYEFAVKMAMGNKKMVNYFWPDAEEDVVRAYFHIQKYPNQGLELEEQGVAEGLDSAMGQQLAQLAQDPNFDAIYAALGRNDALGAKLQDMAQDISRDYRLHMDDDIERIIDILADRLENDYGQGVAKGTEDKSFDKMLRDLIKNAPKQATADRREAKKQTKQQAKDAFANMFGDQNPADILNIRKKTSEAVSSAQQAAIAISKKKNKVSERQQCPECGGPSYQDQMLAEKKDACYHKVRSRYKVWPSAYASGALVKCRKKGAKNWGNKSK